MKTKIILLSVLLAVGVLLLRSQPPAAASPVQQETFSTPTPGPDGQIIYIVQGGDTCAGLARLFSLSVVYIRTTNLLDENCSLREGQRLLMGIGGPSAISPTPEPSVSPTTTQTPAPGTAGTADVCVLVYDDVNGDALRETSEVAIAGAAVSLTSQEGPFSQAQPTVINTDSTAYQGVCFKNIPPGKYNVSGAAPDGYNPTINMTTAVEVTAGDTVYVDFGAQSQTAPGAKNPSKGSSPLLGVIGALFLLGGLGLGVYSWRMTRK
jgi:hypothetical protein